MIFTVEGQAPQIHSNQNPSNVPSNVPSQSPFGPGASPPRPQAAAGWHHRGAVEQLGGRSRAAHVRVAPGHGALIAVIATPAQPPPAPRLPGRFPRAPRQPEVGPAAALGVRTAASRRGVHGRVWHLRARGEGGSVCTSLAELKAPKAGAGGRALGRRVCACASATGVLWSELAVEGAHLVNGVWGASAF